MDEEESLECPVCMEVYDEGCHTPKMMSCLHTLCASCIEELVIHGQLQTNHGQAKRSKEPHIPRGKFFVCPSCRENISTDRVQTNRYVLAHLRDLQRLQSQENKQSGEKAIASDANSMTDIPRSNRRQRVEKRRELRRPASDPQLQNTAQITPSPPKTRRHKHKRQSAPLPPGHSLPNLSPQSPCQQQLINNQEAIHMQTPKYMAPEVPPIKSKRRTKGAPKFLPLSSPNQASAVSYNNPSTPVAGHPPLVHPKLPPATTFHQQHPNHEQSRAVMKIIGESNPAIPENDFCYAPPNSANSIYPNLSQLAPPSAPPSIPNEDMWCRTCEEPSSADCMGHDLIPLLQDEEVNWIQTNQQRMSMQVKVDSTDRDLAKAMNETSIKSNMVPTDQKEAQGIATRSPEITDTTIDMSKWRYAKIRDTINTSTDPDIMLMCYQELDRRRIEYHRTIKKKKQKIKFIMNLVS